MPQQREHAVPCKNASLDEVRRARHMTLNWDRTCDRCRKAGAVARGACPRCTTPTVLVWHEGPCPHLSSPAATSHGIAARSRGRVLTTASWTGDGPPRGAVVTPVVGSSGRSSRTSGLRVAPTPS